MSASARIENASGSEAAEGPHRAGASSQRGKGSRKRGSREIPVSVGAALIALGVVYGDLGTSPVYMTKAVVSGQGGLACVTEEMVLGMLSLVIWTLTLITTVKYVLIAMKADNHLEGGIFALYSVVRRSFKFLAVPAMLGGAAFLADSILTPAVAITSAVEGLRTIPMWGDTVFSDQFTLVAISLVIIAVLFFIQHSGTTSIGRLFGPLMAAWIVFVGITGAVNLVTDFSVLRAFNPVYGIQFILSPGNKAGLAILGSVFLTITGAEALYSDMGHVGRGNIYVTWPIVKVALILNYLGQGAWLLANQGNAALYAEPDLNPFFQMLAPELRPFAVVFGVVAGLIASQSLISGALTLVSEAARLDWMPHMRVLYPSETKGQLYIPLVNSILWAGVTLVILAFQTSHNMEAAYGLALTVTMLSTTILLTVYIWKVWKRPVLAFLYILFFGFIEAMFFASSLTKFFHGGYFTCIMAAAILAVMMAWSRGTKVERSQRQRLNIHEVLPAFEQLAEDESVPVLADNLVYLTSDNEMGKIDRDIVYSVFARRPKRANAYWIVNIVTANEPYTREYSVDSFGTGRVFRVRIRLGYKVNQVVRVYLTQIMRDMVASEELKPQIRPYSDFDGDLQLGDTRYVILHKALVSESDAPQEARLAIKLKYFIRHYAGSPIQWYGLESTAPIVEFTPLFLRQVAPQPLKRVRLRGQKLTPAAEQHMHEVAEAVNGRKHKKTAKPAPAKGVEQDFRTKAVRTAALKRAKASRAKSKGERA